MNLIILSGTALGAAELRVASDSGQSFASFELCELIAWYDKSGTLRTSRRLHNISAFDSANKKHAAWVAANVKRGSYVFVYGFLSYTDSREGAMRYATIRADQVTVPCGDSGDSANVAMVFERSVLRDALRGGDDG